MAKNDNSGSSGFTRRIGLVIGLVIVIFLVLSSIVIIPAGSRGVLLDWGAVSGATFTPGLHFIIPIYQSVYGMNVRTQLYSVVASGASKDLQSATTEVGLDFQLNYSAVPTVYNKYGDVYTDTLIAPIVQSVVKADTARFNATDLIDERDLVQSTIQTGLTNNLSKYGIIVQQVSLTNFTFSAQYSAAIENKTTEQQHLLQQKVLLNITQIEAEQREAAALGNETAAIELAAGQRNATIELATGQANAIDAINAALHSSPDYLKYQALAKWNGALPVVMTSGSSGGVLPLLNLNPYTLQQNSTANSSLNSSLINQITQAEANSVTTSNTAGGS